MASNKILKFYKGSTTPAGAAIGSIFFDTNTREIKVRVADSGDVQWESYAGKITDAKWENQHLIINRADGTAINLDFTDVASDADLTALKNRVSAIENWKGTADSDISTLKSEMDAVEAKAAANETAIGTLNGTGEGSVAKAVADAEARVKVTTDAITGRVSTLETTVNTDHKGRIEALEAKFGEGDGSVDSKITAAIEALDTPEAGVTGDGAYVDVTVKQVNGKVTEVIVAENDIASAKDLSDEVTRATNAENAINAKIGGNYGTGEGQVTVAADVQAAKDAAAAAQADIDAFLVTTETDNGVLDTLKEIQDFLTSDEGTVQTLLDKVATNETAIATLNGDATTTGSVAKAVADAEGRINGTIEANENATSAAITELDGRIDALEGLNAGTELSGIKNRVTAVETWKSGLSSEYTAQEGKYIASVKQVDGKVEATYGELPVIPDVDDMITTAIDALDATVKDEADYVTGEIVQENGKLTSVAFVAKTGSVAAAADGLAVASDVKAYVDGLWVWEEFE